MRPAAKKAKELGRKAAIKVMSGEERPSDDSDEIIPSLDSLREYFGYGDEDDPSSDLVSAFLIGAREELVS